MSLLDLLTHAWRMFWANILNPGSLMLFALVLIIALLAGFAMARTMSAMRAALRAISAVMVFILIYGLLGALGISLHGLAPLGNWLLDLMQAPFIIPE